LIRDRITNGTNVNANDPRISLVRIVATSVLLINNPIVQIENSKANAATIPETMGLLVWGKGEITFVRNEAMAPIIPSVMIQSLEPLLGMNVDNRKAMEMAITAYGIPENDG
jgi:hypothetical protein